MFPLDKIPKIQQTPENYRLISRIPELVGPVQIRERRPATSDLNLTIVDTETTGLEDDDEIIELGLVSLAVCPVDLHVLEIQEAVSLFREPKNKPITEESIEKNGITQDMVAGHDIDWDDVARKWFANGRLIVAHHSYFDRKHIDRHLPEWAQDAPWACTVDEIDWADMGFGCRKLGCLAREHGVFFGAHRAAADCVAVAWVLALNRYACRALVLASQQTTYRINALGSPFQVKDELRARGYRPHYENGKFVYWYLDHVSEVDLPGEKTFLDGLRGYTSKKASINPFTARTRYKEGK